MEKLPDPSDSPTLVPESSPPARPQPAAQTLTPPPSSADSPTMVPESGSSDAPTMVPLSSSGGAPQTGSGVSSSPGAWSAEGLPLGTILGGRYEILQALGEGGMGAVYKARDKELDRLVALKVIRPDLARNPAIIQRFKQELILARQVTHRNVVRIFDLGEADGIKFITMEFIEGKDLRSLLLEHKKFSPEEAVDIIRQVCLALDTAHSEGVIHRDLKPQNIMRDATGRIVVMDFGLARSLESDGMTQTGALIGTMEYMSPEQGLGQELDQRSDLFTLGLIFYELLSGQVPYKADSALASLLKRTQERAAPVSSLDNNVPAVLSNFVSKCLERDPKLRYSSAKELLSDLEAWQGKSAAASIRLPDVQPWGQDIPWVGISVAAVVLILVVTGFLLRGKLFGPSAKGPTGPVVSLAILPFRNASGDPALNW
ncbi:MAG TPA: protein kinase, partial [Terriglobales bacterium]|nr:protein kinase [Terriglobales bacterium]